MLSPSWQGIDSWWAEYAEEQQAGVKELRDVIIALNDAWADSGSRFDVDPLVADWQDGELISGPLRTNQEENWSQWLAYLIDTSNGGFIEVLFDDVPSESPKEVQREVSVPGRRADIVCHFDGESVSIEVKIDDEEYVKTGETARKLERGSHYEWTHYLLLPEEKRQRLQSVFEATSADATVEERSINIEDDPNVRLLYWQDVSRALRLTLLQGRERDSHWEASAYLFITLIELEICQYYPAETLEKGPTGTTPGITELHQIQSIDINKQRDALEGILEEVDYE